jgi:hypothetical protein
MRFIKVTACFGFLILSGTANAQTPAETKQIVDLMVRLCIAGGHAQASSGAGSGEADISLRSLDVKGNVKGEFKVSRSDVEGLVNGIDNALSQVAANEADKVRDCLTPVKDRLLNILLPQPSPVQIQPSPTKCNNDEPAQYPEIDQTQVTAFTYHAADPGNPGPRYWSRVTPDRWVEKSGPSQDFFSVEKRIHFGLCDGTVVSKIGDNLQLLISDKTCPTKGLLFRRPPQCVWFALPHMENVH